MDGRLGSVTVMQVEEGVWGGETREEGGGEGWGGYHRITAVHAFPFRVHFGEQ